MSCYTLHVEGVKTGEAVKGTSPRKALEELCEQAGLTLASQDGRYGRLDDGRHVSALTAPWGRRRLDPLERQTRV